MNNRSGGVTTGARIKKLASTIQSQATVSTLYRSINEFLINFPMQTENKDALFRKRTSDEIINDGFATGCTDLALVALGIMKCLDMHVEYIETLVKPIDCLEKIQQHQLPSDGHVFIRVKGKTAYKIFDTLQGFVDEYMIAGITFYPVAQGTDYLDLKEYEDKEV